MTVAEGLPTVPQHADEPRSNADRQRLARVEPKSLRTYTPSLAVIARSAGSYHWTTDGRKLADFTSGVLVANLGHNPRRWWQRVWQYLRVGPELPGQSGPDSGYFDAAPLSTYNATTEIEIAASERLLSNLQREQGGQRCEQVVWAASGSEAVQKALWTALQRRPGQQVVLATRHGFHGKKGLAGAVSGHERDHNRDPRVRFVSFPMFDCCNLDERQKPLDLSIYRSELESLWRQHRDEICCLITEPYLGGGGSFHPQFEYLQMLQEFCRLHDIVFILDEIQSNFGRTGPMYAFKHYGVEPDIVCLGKGLGNGVPVSAAVGRTDLFATLNFGEASDTWSGNPLSCAAALATLDEFEQTDVLAQGQKLSDELGRGLARLGELPAVANVRGEGTVWGIECAAVRSQSANQVANEIVRRCYLGDQNSRAVHLLGPLAGKVIRVSPPLVFSQQEAREYLDVIYQIISQIS